EGDLYHCRAESPHAGAILDVYAAVVVAAHGSWEPGQLPTQAPRPRPHPGDLFGFKAHFHDSDLPPGLMPLLVFPGGSGGAARRDSGRVSLSCCVRRDQLARLRQPGKTAGELVLEYIADSCLGVRRALARARREGDWLSAGPIRPGVRLPGR